MPHRRRRSHRTRHRRQHRPDRRTCGLVNLPLTARTVRWIRRQPEPGQQRCPGGARCPASERVRGTVNFTGVRFCWSALQAAHWAVTFAWTGVRCTGGNASPLPRACCPRCLRARRASRHRGGLSASGARTGHRRVWRNGPAAAPAYAAQFALVCRDAGALSSKPGRPGPSVAGSVRAKAPDVGAVAGRNGVVARVRSSPAPGGPAVRLDH